MKTLICVDCRNQFVFPDKQEKLFREQNWPNPKRCHRCRIIHKKSIETTGKNSPFYPALKQIKHENKTSGRRENDASH